MHKADKCTLKKPCNVCKELHLTVLHDANAIKTTKNNMVASSSPELLNMDQPNRSHKVMLKVSGKFCHLGLPVAHAVPPMQFRHVSRMRVMRRSFTLSNSAFM